MDTQAIRNRRAASATDADTAVAAFLDAQQRVLDRYRVPAQRRYVEVPATGGQAQVLVAGEGPQLVMVIGGAVPAVFWAPLMARLPGRTLYVVELPGFGLTDPMTYEPDTLRRRAVDHLAGVLDALGLGPGQFVTQSMGSQWTSWLAADRPGTVTAQVMVGCPAFFLDTSAVLPFQLASVPGLGRLLMSLQKPSVANTERMMRIVGEDPAGLAELRDVLLAAACLPTYTPSLLELMRASMRWTRPRPAVVTTPAHLRLVAHPVRLIWGRGDPFGPVDAGRRIADAIPAADLHVVPGGHAPWFHHADLVARLTRAFLQTSEKETS
jgi:pimeloyl-ACP methyl ester carboxylesterase